MNPYESQENNYYNKLQKHRALINDGLVFFSVVFIGVAFIAGLIVGVIFT